MLQQYLAQANLLTQVIPLCFESAPLALKGGTAINLFYNDLPRLSVDLDCVYVDRSVPRAAALDEINDILRNLATDFSATGFKAFTNRSADERLTKILVSDGNATVKIEVNPVHRGVLLYPELMPFAPKVQELFSTSEKAEIPLLARDELYAGKLVAALDRQHPRDLFDVAVLMASEGGITETMLDCFTVYLASNPRPFHEVLCGNDQDIRRVFEVNFKGMTDVVVAVEDLELTRSQLRSGLLSNLGEARFEFLHSLLRLEPRWDLLPFEDLDQLPALRWKLSNLERLADVNPEKFSNQQQALEDLYESTLSHGRARHPSRFR